MDVFGNKKKKFNYTLGEIKIEVNFCTLMNGTYIIHIYNGKI